MNIGERAKDGGMKSDFNQSDFMQEQLEDCKRARSGLSLNWNRVTNNYRQNYDAIQWEGGKYGCS